jgi:ChrB-like protein
LIVGAVGRAMNWLLLVYRIPREPTAGRVYVWRKLKQLGAISVQDAVWVLPATPRTQEQFQWLASEIVELGGSASLFESQLIYANDAHSLREQFEGRARAAYEEILAALKHKKPDLAALSKKYQEALDYDYFQCDLGQRVRKKLLGAEGAKS